MVIESIAQDRWDICRPILHRLYLRMRVLVRKFLSRETFSWWYRIIGFWTFPRDVFCLINDAELQLRLELNSVQVFTWPIELTLNDHEDHLILGLSLEAMVWVLLEMKFLSSYVREEKLGWVTKVYGEDPTGYDICSAVREFLLSKEYKRFSVAEVLEQCKFAGAGLADFFLSHAQSEDPWTTLRVLNNHSCGEPIRYFTDYFCLRQCFPDFNLPKVKSAIQSIGRVLLLLDPLDKPFTLTRTFCIFEIYSVVEGHVDFLTGSPRSLERDLTLPAKFLQKLTALFCIQVDVQKAEARNIEDKEKIDDMIREGPGFAVTNRACEDAIASTFLRMHRRARLQLASGVLFPAFMLAVRVRGWGFDVIRILWFFLLAVFSSLMLGGEVVLLPLLVLMVAYVYLATVSNVEQLLGDEGSPSDVTHLFHVIGIVVFAIMMMVWAIRAAMTFRRTLASPPKAGKRAVVAQIVAVSSAIVLAIVFYIGLARLTLVNHDPSKPKGSIIDIIEILFDPCDLGKYLRLVETCDED